MRQLLILVFTAILFANCNSNKGWTAAEREKGLKLCLAETEAKLGEKDGKKFCACLLSKAESKYPTYAAADKAITDEEGEKMGKACVKDIGLKVGGEGGDEEVTEEGGGKKKGGLFGGDGDDEETGGGKKKGGLFGGDDEEKGGGGWSKTDRTTFFTQCKTGLVQQGYDASRATKLCNCFLEKVESRYSSMKEADERGGEAAGTKAMKECLTEENGSDN